jgi:23S rRNA (cytosine1962-C5)-methyltransferase
LSDSARWSSIDQPTASELRLATGLWSSADLRYDPGDGWSRSIEPWTIDMDGLLMELRPRASGGVGLYSEHLANLAWVADQVRSTQRPRPGVEPAVLNLFAHTGLTTLAAARAGAAVAHVDAARGAVAWARRNAELSGLADRPIRWLVDDAMAFVAREARRGRQYDGIVLDPPSFGRAKEGRRSRTWRLEDELPALLAACRDVVANDAWVLLTAHTEGIDGAELEALLVRAFPVPRGRVRTAPLGLEATSGARLDLGWVVRLTL